MTAEEVEAALAQLQAAFPGQASNLPDDTYELWGNTLSQQDADDVFDAVELWISRERYWPTVAGLREVIREARAERGDYRQEPTRIRCDGSGWVFPGGDREACPSCNRALMLVYRDPKKLRLFREGRPLHQVLGMKREEFSDEFESAPCPKPIDGESLLTIEPSRGREMAATAYREECAEQGREPNGATLSGMLGAVG